MLISNLKTAFLMNKIVKLFSIFGSKEKNLVIYLKAELWSLKLLISKIFNGFAFFVLCFLKIRPLFRK